MAVPTRATVIQAVFGIIYDRISTDVTSVTLSDATTSTIQTYTGAFPDSEIDTKSSYPICIVNSPEVIWEDFTFTRKYVNGEFTIDIYTTKAEAADLFLDAIIESIETYKGTLKNTDKMSFVNLISTDSDSVMRGNSMKVHIRSVTFGFKFPFTKSAGT